MPCIRKYLALFTERASTLQEWKRNDAPPPLLEIRMCRLRYKTLKFHRILERNIKTHFLLAKTSFPIK